MLRKPSVIDNLLNEQTEIGKKWAIAKPLYLHSFAEKLYHALLVLTGNATAVNFVEDVVSEKKLLNEDKVWIKAAAIRVNIGNNEKIIIEGKHHGKCFGQYFREHSSSLNRGNHFQGFTTNKGEYVSRTEAGKIAFAAGQILDDPKGNMIISENIWFHGPCDYNPINGYYFREGK